MGNAGFYGIRRIARMMGGKGPSIMAATAKPTDAAASGLDSSLEGSLILAHNNAITYVDDSGDFQTEGMDA